MERIATALIVAVLGASTPTWGAQTGATAHAIAMHGAPKYGPEFTHFDYVNPTAPKGGDVRLHAIGTFDSLNGLTLKGVAAAGSLSIYDSLLQRSYDEAFTQYGLLAETIEMPEDRSWVAFTLRKEARWHDGKPFTADDVIFTFDKMLDPTSKTMSMRSATR